LPINQEEHARHKRKEQSNRTHNYVIAGWLHMPFSGIYFVYFYKKLAPNRGALHAIGEQIPQVSSEKPITRVWHSQLFSSSFRNQSWSDMIYFRTKSCCTSIRGWHFQKHRVAPPFRVEIYRDFLIFHKTALFKSKHIVIHKMHISQFLHPLFHFYEPKIHYILGWLLPILAYTIGARRWVYAYRHKHNHIRYNANHNFSRVTRITKKQTGRDL
jgi:hypothetical protein